MLENIKKIKAQLGKNLLILAHHYQNDDIINVADYVGDSLKLAQIAQKNKEAKYIIFCGVHFMAETADILTEKEQIVILPDKKAGCPMADMANISQIEKAWEILINNFGETIIPITYINSKAEIKAFCGRHGGSTVTSSNAKNIVSWALKKKERILFLPDQNLGRNTAFDLGIPIDNMIVYNQNTNSIEGDYSEYKNNIKIILWNGYCSVHDNIKIDSINKIKHDYPEMKIIVHPECRHEIVNASDMNGSTEYIIETVKNSEKGTQWAIGTECNLVNRIKSQNNDKKIIIIDDASICNDMNLIGLDALNNSLTDILNNDFKNQIKVGEDIAEGAKTALNTMLFLS